MDEAKREELGKAVRDEWVAWAKEQPNPKPSWVVPWEGLSEPDKEVDRRIGVRLFNAGVSMSGSHKKVRAMTKTNGYAKREALIEDLRTVLDENAIALESLVEGGWLTDERAVVVVTSLVERARAALNSRKP